MNNHIDASVRMGENVRIGNNVTIGAGCYIDHDVIIRDNVTIGANTFVGARCILGEYLVDFFDGYTNKEHPLIIGEGSCIRSETIIYGDCKIGPYFQTGHRVTIREQSQIGHHVRIGTLSDIQGFCEIQNYVNLHSNVHVGQHSKIENYAWIYPYVVLTNDPTPPSETMKGVTVKEFAVVATGTIVMPGMTIGQDALVGAGAIVTKPVADMHIAVGNPAKDVGNVEKIVDKETGKKVYPWRYTFDRGMPWKGIGYDAWMNSKETESNK